MDENMIVPRELINAAIDFWLEKLPNCTITYSHILMFVAGTEYQKIKENYQVMLNSLIEINSMCADVGNAPDGKLNSGIVAKISIEAINKAKTN